MSARAARSVVQITPYYPPHLGGLERVVQHLAEELAHRHDVQVVTTALGSAGAPRREVRGGVRVRRHRAVELAHTAVSPSLAGALLRGPRQAVLHLHCAHALMPEVVALTARLRRRRFLLHFHLDVDASGPIGRLLPLYKTHLFGRALRAAAGVIVLTPAQARFVAERYRVPQERIFVVPNGVGREYFMAPREQREGPLRLLFVGRLGVQKNVARLLDALALVREPVRLRVVGDGELRPALEQQAARLGLRNVEFSGGLLGAELVRAYAEADAFVLPSDKEGMPLVALEAMAAALPVIATRVPGNSELLDGTGLLADPDPASLAAAVDAVAAGPELRAELSRRSAEAAPAYSWPALAQQVEGIYDRVYA